MGFEKDMKYVRATLGFEGLKLSEAEEKLLEKKYKGEITKEQYEREALKLAHE
ncbi:hypothetical protein P8881_19630 [Bacillus haynesii]|uniref:hypothetical protein n=1 Tax=Bacillus haynesii TaxID=1925021 RepID=UPI00227FE8F9|nr:hypothetical protein [Bacillus haynesii]MCY8737548.1 hypothetical protein [Bacillus haynesii]MEC0709738.1 hypothetical protein [Bacillus haynesii]MEC0736883.1 hypothetical protein [Bacillus haynesii]